MSKNLSTKNLLASITETYGRDGKYFRFGTQDNFPNLLAEYVNDSGTAKSCVDRLNQFLQGKGFASETFADTMANGTENWTDLLFPMSNQLNYFMGLAIQVKFDKAGRPARYYTIDFQHIRKRADGLFIYNPDLGDPQGYNVSRKYSNMIIPAYRIAETPEEEAQLAAQRRKLVDEQVKEYGEQLGEILYVYQKGIGLNYDKYPVPTYASGLGDISADAGLSTHEDNTVNNSFKGDTVITTHVLNREVKDENEQTEADRFEESIEGFTGADGSSVLHLEADLSGGNQPSVEVLNNQHKMDATEAASDRISKKVCRWFGVPPVLVGIDTAGKLGDNQELVNKLKLFNLTLEDKRKLIYKAIKSLFISLPKEAYVLEQLDLFDYLPDEIVKTLTPEQRQEIYNLPETNDATTPQAPEGGEVQKEVVETNEVLTNLTGRQVQNYERILRKYNNGKLSEAQARIMLSSGFGFTLEQINEILEIEQDEAVNN